MLGNLDAAERWYRKAIERCRANADNAHAYKLLKDLASLLDTQPARLAEARRVEDEALKIATALDAGTARP